MLKREQQIGELILELANPATRRQAVEALAALGGPAMDALGRTACDGPVDTRLVAIQALGQIGEPAVQSLCALLSDKDSVVSEGAAAALVRIGAPAVEPLCRKLGDPNLRAAHLAMTALAKVRKPAVEALCCSLGDPDPGVRVYAARALVQAGAVAIPALTRALRRPEIYLKVSGQNRSFSLAKEGRWLRRGVAGVLVEIGDHGIDVLCRELGSPEEEVRQAASEALVECGEPAVEPLSRRLEFEPDRERRLASQFPASLATECARLLGRIGHVSAMEPLVRALDHPDKRVRIAAAYGIAELARATRSPELRALRPRLRLRWAKLNWSDPRSEEVKSIAFLAQAIERATAAIAAVPLPSATHPPGNDTLPRPAGSADTRSELLPIAADADHAVSPRLRDSWWLRLTGRFRNPD